MRLDELEKNISAIITGFGAADKGLKADPESDIETRLREIGFAEGDEIMILHMGLIRKNPITVSVNGTLIAMRRHEAAAIKVKLGSAHDTN